MTQRSLADRIAFYLRPEFVFRPIQLLKLIQQKLRSTQEFETVDLPWGMMLRLRPYDFLGFFIWWTGVYDLAVTETIWRLLEAGELAVDVGANIGYMTSIMAAKVGMAGHVIAFEPYPEVYADLTVNLNCWQQQGLQITAHAIALGETSGEGLLSIPDRVKANRGLASLVPEAQTVSQQTCTVKIQPLDDVFNDATQIALMKLDVEGYELPVLKGASKLLQQHQIRDIIFEEHHPYPTPVTDFLESQGYQLFYINKQFWGLTASDVRQSHQNKPHSTDAPSYLATLDPARVIDRLAQSGWQTLTV